MGCTALDEASERGHEDICSVLFGRGALRLTLTTALHLAAFHNNIVAANALLAKGADVKSASKVSHKLCHET
jgi:Ankyrin repeats (3 copies)